MFENETISIQSHKGPYRVQFVDNPFATLSRLNEKKPYYLIDEKVYSIYQKPLEAALGSAPILKIIATEDNKDLSQIPDYILKLTQLGIKRNHELVIIGGGILQDIGCFLAATLFRGMAWTFFPTTLLAQADSCIGSKSSINVAGVKNLVGTFTPPKEIFISLSFLKSLSHAEMLSGLGEMIKVHGIDGIQSLKEMARDYDSLLKDNDIFKKYLLRSLNIKKRIIELDEFDTGPRLVMNFGHTFGHAVESASKYEIPHGIAISIGQSMAAAYSYQSGKISKDVFQSAQELLNKNFGDSKEKKINFEKFMESISKDKKNLQAHVALILPMNDNYKIEKQMIPLDDGFKSFCKNYFAENAFYAE